MIFFFFFFGGGGRGSGGGGRVRGGGSGLFFWGGVGGGGSGGGSGWWDEWARVDVNAMLGVGGDVMYGGCEPRVEGIVQGTLRYCTILRK